MTLCVGQTGCVKNQSLLLSIPTLPPEEESPAPKTEQGTKLAALTLSELEASVPQLSLPQPPYPSYTSIATAPHRGTMGRIFNALRVNSLSLDTGILWLNSHLPSAVEDYLPSNINLKTSLFNYDMQKGILGIKANCDLEWARNFHLESDDTQRLNAPNVGVKMDLAPIKYLFFFGGINEQNEFNQYQSPTLFYPNAEKLSLQEMIGVQGRYPAWKASLAVAFTNRNTWGNYRFQSPIDNSFEFDGAGENMGMLNIQFIKRFSSDKKYAPHLTVDLGISVYGNKNVPQVLKIGDEMVVNGKQVLQISQYRTGFSLDWKSISVSGTYEYRGSKYNGRQVFDPEHFGSAGAELRTKYGDWGIAWQGFFNVDPTAPATLHAIQLPYRLPILNRSLMVNHSFSGDHYVIGPNFDMLRFYDYFYF